MCRLPCWTSSAPMPSTLERGRVRQGQGFGGDCWGGLQAHGANASPVADPEKDMTRNQLEARPCRPKFASAAEQVEKTKHEQHQLVYGTDRARCVKCCQISLCSTTRSGRRLQWTTRPCPSGSSLSHLSLLGRQGLGLTIGSTQAHISHVLIYSKGIVWCEKCGAYATAALQTRPRLELLSHICMQVPTRRGRGFLNRLRSGRPPRPDIEWPTPDE